MRDPNPELLRSSTRCRATGLLMTQMSLLEPGAEGRPREGGCRPCCPGDTSEGHPAEGPWSRNPGLSPGTEPREDAETQPRRLVCTAGRVVTEAEGSPFGRREAGGPGRRRRLQSRGPQAPHPLPELKSSQVPAQGRTGLRPSHRSLQGAQPPDWTGPPAGGTVVCFAPAPGSDVSSIQKLPHRAPNAVRQTPGIWRAGGAALKGTIAPRCTEGSTPHSFPGADCSPNLTRETAVSGKLPRPRDALITKTGRTDSMGQEGFRPIDDPLPWCSCGVRGSEG